MAVTTAAHPRRFREPANRLLAEFGAGIACELLATAQRFRFAAGATPDFDDCAVHFVERGLISERWSGADGRQAETTLIGCEGAVGFVEALAQTPSNAVFKVVANCSGWSVSAAALRALVARDQAAAEVAWAYAAARVRAGHIGVGCGALHGVKARLCDTLLNYAESVDDGASVTTTHEILAESLGACRSTVTTMLSDLAREGVLRPGRGRQTILDWTRLNRVACGCRRIAPRFAQGDGLEHADPGPSAGYVARGSR